MWLGTAGSLAGALWGQSASISGRVSNLFTGNPVRKAHVALGDGAHTAVTDSEGRYKLAGIPPGRYRLLVERPGFLSVVYGAHGPNRPGKSLVLGPGETRANVDFTLEPPAVITGHVFDENGEPLTVNVQAWRESYLEGHRQLDAFRSTITDDEGEYRLYGLPPGRYYVATAQTAINAGGAPLRMTYPQTFYPGSEEIASATSLRLAPGGEARNIDFHLRKTATVTVTVSIDGMQAPDQYVNLTLQGRDRKTVLRANTNAGEFRVDGVTPGSYLLSAASQIAGGQYYARLNLDVGTLDSAGIRLTLLKAPDVPGTLRVATDAVMDRSAFVVTLSKLEQPAVPVHARPSPDGAFVLSGVPPGTRSVTVTPLPEGMYLKSPREVEIGPEPKPVEIEIASDGARVEGKVAAEQGKTASVEGVTVLLIADSVLKHQVTDDKGTFVFVGIPPGKYRLLALEDIETNSWQDPQVLHLFDGKGTAVELRAGQKAVVDLALTQ